MPSTPSVLNDICPATTYKRRPTGKDTWQFAENVNWVKTVNRKTGVLVERNNPQIGKSQTICPSILGARSWNAGAPSPKSGRCYTNGHEFCRRVAVGPQKVEDLAYSQPYFDTAELELVAPPGKKASRRFALGATLFAGVALGAPAAAEPSAEELADPQWVQAGRTKFIATCSCSHGSKGDAGKSRPFRERIDWDAMQIYSVISEGHQRAANVMPAWKGAIPGAQVWQIVAYIKSLGGKPKQPS